MGHSENKTSVRKIYFTYPAKCAFFRDNLQFFNQKINNMPKVTVRLSIEGDVFPLAYEMQNSPEVIITHLKKLGDCKEVNNRYIPVVIPHKNGFIRIRTEEILYLEAEGSYCSIHFCTGKKLFIAVPMGTLSDDFSEQGLVRCHKRYTVNITYVNFISGNSLTLTGGVELTIGKTYKKTVISCFNYRGTRSRKYN